METRDLIKLRSFPKFSLRRTIPRDCTRGIPREVSRGATFRPYRQLSNVPPRPSSLHPNEPRHRLRSYTACGEYVYTDINRHIVMHSVYATVVLYSMTNYTSARGGSCCAACTRGGKHPIKSRASVTPPARAEKKTARRQYEPVRQA